MLGSFHPGEEKKSGKESSVSTGIYSFSILYFGFKVFEFFVFKFCYLFI